MGIKDKMMESMMGNMSKEEKMEMMGKMMDSFFDGMSNEERSELMNNMMPKMMGEMMSPKSGNMMGMMNGMMKSMMGNKNEKDSETFNPMDMCKNMMSGITESQKVSTLATPEVRVLFEEWVEQIENETLDKIKDKDNIDVDTISKELKLSKESTYYFLTRLAQKGKINIKVEKKE